VTGFEVRPFRRADREQVTLLVNRHAAAVIPGVSASVATVLNQFEREPDEFVVGPWVEERRCLVAEQDGAVVAAALLARYRDDPSVGPALRGAGELRWLLFWPDAPLGNPFWRPAGDAAAALAATCVEQLRRWQVTRIHADGALPLPGVYGVPEQWPHVAQLYADLGFSAPADAVEVLHLADLAHVPAPGAPPGSLRVVRTVGINGTRFSGYLGTERAGYLEVEVLEATERRPRGDGLADIGNLEVAGAHRRRGVATHLLRHAAQWLRLAHVDRLLHYAAASEVAAIAFAERNGFTEMTRTRRGWQLPLQP
jgi:ribosomal protein S18 acetylase RimI-like enzyme